uniref:Uncharacterized protein n=1 Tax=Oryza brachyantha TaxID=4533 RepID=J3KWX8_ORYBR
MPLLVHPSVLKVLDPPRSINQSTHPSNSPHLISSHLITNGSSTYVLLLPFSFFSHHSHSLSWFFVSSCCNAMLL